MSIRVVGILLALLWAAAPAQGGDTTHEVPKKAVCRTCEMSGNDHGPEEVEAWRLHEGTPYYFCSQDCAEAFDSFPAGYARQPLPRPAPRLRVITLAGDTLHVGEPGAGPMLVDLWATWCAPCLETMPQLEKLHRKWSDSGLVVLGISVDEDGAKRVPKFVTKKKLTYPIALDSEENPAWLAFNAAAIPAMFLVDAQGQIVQEWRGRINHGAVTRTLEQFLDAAPRTD